jgi:hypothetical protein
MVDFALMPAAPDLHLVLLPAFCCALAGYLLTSLTAYMSASADAAAGGFAASNTICPTQARECHHGQIPEYPSVCDQHLAGFIIVLAQVYVQVYVSPGLCPGLC